MSTDNIQIFSLNPDNFEYQDYKSVDLNLIPITGSNNIFNQNTDYIEYCVYDEGNDKIFPISSSINLDTYKIINNELCVYPQEDLEKLGFSDSTYSILYNFYTKRLSSSINVNYFIKEISSDRTEIRLDSNVISNEDIVKSANEFIEYRDNQDYFVDFYLNFGDNKTIIANNLKLEDEATDDPTILIKLYEPLPSNFNLKDTLWVVEEFTQPQLFQVKFPFIETVNETRNFIKGPNFNIPIKNKTGKTGELVSFNSLVNTTLTSSANQITNLLEDKDVQINVNYEDRSDYVYFSSAESRLRNFNYKVGLIESYTNSIKTLENSVNQNTQKTTEYSASKASYESAINEIVDKFDGYERFLYYDSGSLFSYPKSNTSPPYNLYSTGSTQVLQWIGSTDSSNAYYGGQLLSASNYDQDNQNYLYWAIPEYLRDDPDNSQYLVFVDMVAQQYDNTWLLTKDLTNKFNADNRLEFGISRDLVNEAIKDFGVKLYSNNFDTDDLYTAFLGLTPSGSIFPIPNVTGSINGEINTPTGFEYVDTKISGSNDIIPLDKANKRLYKRIYHNLPYLFKTKGTITGLRALITSYGIPDTILKINEFGGKDKNESQDWDLSQKVFNYNFDTQGKFNITSSFTVKSDFRKANQSSPNSIQFRIKTPGIPTNLSQSIYSVTSDRSLLLLEYTGSGMVSGSHSGSIPNPENNYGTLKFIPDTSNSNLSASLYLPFFDGGWWSVQTDVSRSNTASLSAANRIGNKLGFTGSSSVVGFDSSYYFDSGTTKIFFGHGGNDISFTGKTYTMFSGSYQEIRYYNEVISSSVFYDYTMNPYSFEGNTINSAPESLIFRADLGSLLNTSSRTSTHPKISGSSQYVTSSFTSNSNFYISSSNFKVNREIIYQDQVPSGIKNRINEKISIDNTIIPSGNVLSPIRSLQQNSLESSSYTPTVDYLEVAFSPQDQINDDINSQLGYFNLGDYIGDPRQISESGVNYPSLDVLRDSYFQKYINSYNVVDFIRLIKFFDNSLFKMIKDFTPANTSLSSGVVIKQHILERNRVRPAQITSSNQTFSGSIKPQVRNYDTGSSDVGQYEFRSGSAIYRFSGGTGGSFERFNGLKSSPSASILGLSNNYHLTQSYTESKEGKLGREIITTFDQKEFYDGEFSGSELTVVTQSLNPECIVYLKNPDKPLVYYPLFFAGAESVNNNINSVDGTVKGLDFIDGRNSPLPGYAWIFNKRDYTATSLDDVLTVFLMKISGTDYYGNEVRDFIEGATSIQFVFPEGIKTYRVDGVVIAQDHATLTVNRDGGDYRFASSSNGGTENWSLRAYGNYRSPSGNIPGFDPNSQGKFHAETTNQSQAFRYYNQGGDSFVPSVVGDPLNFFNTGSTDMNTVPLFNDTNGFKYGAYIPTRTSNVPWVVSCSIAYSASGGGDVNVVTSTNGIYHSGSFFSNQMIEYDGVYGNAGAPNYFKGTTSGVNPPFIGNPNLVGSILVANSGSTNTTHALTGSLNTIIYFTGSNGSNATTETVFRNGSEANSAVMYLDPRLTQPYDFNTLFYNFNYNDGKYYRIGNNHVAQIAFAPGTQIGSLGRAYNFVPNSQIDTSDGVVRDALLSGSFALPPNSIQSITLDETFFTSSFNRLKSGDRISSSADDSGHSKIHVGGTASLSFDYSQLEMGQPTYPGALVEAPVIIDEFNLGPSVFGVGTVGAQYRHLSGSALNPNNVDFTAIQGNNTYFSNFDATNIGEYQFNSYNFWVDYFDSQGGNINASVVDYSVQLSATIEYSLDRSPVGTEKLILAFAERENLNVDPFPLPQQQDTGAQTGTISLVINSLGGPPTTTNNGYDRNFSIMLGWDGIEDILITYKVTNWRLKFSVNAGAAGNNAGGTTIEENARFRQGTDLINTLTIPGKSQSTPTAQAVYHALVQPKLFITGSDFHPKQLVGIAPGYSQIPTGSAVMKWEGSGSLNNIRRTSSVSYNSIVYDNGYIDPAGGLRNYKKVTFKDPNFLGNTDSLGNLNNYYTQPSSSIIIPSMRRASDLSVGEVVYEPGTTPLIEYAYKELASNISATDSHTVAAQLALTQSMTYSANDRAGFDGLSQFTLETEHFRNILNAANKATGFFRIRFINPSNVLKVNTIKVIASPNVVQSFGTPGTENAAAISTIDSGTGTLYPTINKSSSIYYPEYKFSNFKKRHAGTANSNFIEQMYPAENLDFPKLVITNSVDFLEDGYKMTGSLRIHKGDYDDLTTLGPVVFEKTFIVPESESIDTVTVSGSIGLSPNTFKYNDAFRMSLSVEKGLTSFLDITEYTMSLFPSESQFGQITEDLALYGVAAQPDGADYGQDLYGGSLIPALPGFNKYAKPTLTNVILSSYYGQGVLPFAIMLDCQPLLNNYNAQRKSTYLMDVDYTNITGSITPVNYLQILSGSAFRATVPDSNYTQQSSTLSRYDGTKATSAKINKWSPLDRGTFGELPVIELRTAYFGYFNSISNLYPILNDAINLNISYFIDQQGNAIPPTLEAGFGSAIVEKAYSKDDIVTLSFNSASKELESMDPVSQIIDVGRKPFPVTYTQNGPRTYSRNIFLSGSGRLSLYDNLDENAFTSFAVTAEGTSSLKANQNNLIPIPSTYSSGEPFIDSPRNYILQVLDPKVSGSAHSGAANHRFVYTGSNNAADLNASGSFKFTDPNQSSGLLSNPQKLYMETSFHTSFLYEGYRRRKNDGEELKFQIQMLVNGEGVPFELEDIEMIIHKTSGNPINLGSIIGAGKGTNRFPLCRFVGTKKVTRGRGKRRKTTNSTYSTTDIVYNETHNSYYIGVENPAYEEFMKKRGVYVKDTGDVQFRGDMTATEWKIIANSGDREIKHNDEVKFILKLALLQSVKKEGNNVFYPTAYNGPINPVRIQVIGGKDHLMDTANTASAPFWVYTGSAGNGSQSIIDQSILEMSSSIFNEGYGEAYYQATLNYTTGKSDYFPSGTEPTGTTIGAVESPLILKVDDEIRFQNTEDHAYIITKVIPPSENLGRGDTANSQTGRLKIHLDRPVPGGVNKDFFLVRRYQDSPNSFIIDGTYPYNINNSGSEGRGVVFPEFPATDLSISSSQIVTDLVSKGIIT